MYLVTFGDNSDAAICQTKKEAEELIYEVYEDNPDVSFGLYKVGDDQKINVKVVPFHIEIGED